MKKVTLGILVCMLLILASVPVASAAPASASCGVTHIVRRGQNLYRIALRYGTSVQAIARANGIANPNRIYTGQRLYIPCKPKPPASRRIHIVRRGQTLAGIARWYGTSVRAIVRANNIRNPNRIYPGQRLVIPKGWTPTPKHGRWYTVRSGDTLSGIAYRSGVSMWSIVRANNIRYPSRIYAGQRLYIP